MILTNNHFILIQKWSKKIKDMNICVSGYYYCNSNHPTSACGRVKRLANPFPKIATRKLVQIFININFRVLEMD